MEFQSVRSRVIALRERILLEELCRVVFLSAAANGNDFHGASEFVGYRSMSIKEELLTIVCAAMLLGWGYYCVRWPAKTAGAYNFYRKRPLGERHIRVMGWAMLAGGLFCLSVAIAWVIEALR